MGGGTLNHAFQADTPLMIMAALLIVIHVKSRRWEVEIHLAMVIIDDHRSELVRYIMSKSYLA